MRFHEQTIGGVWVIEAEPHVDERGALRRHFCAEEFAAHGLCPHVAQGNVSENTHRHTLRGFHYQEAPHGESKTLSCLTGGVHAVVADIRPESATYMRWVAVELSAANRRSLHVPVGCAMAILTLEHKTVMHYYMSEPFRGNAYRGFRFDDPAFGVVWPALPRVISEKDRSYPDFVPAGGGS